jgi:hypothetical protein
MRRGAAGTPFNPLSLGKHGGCAWIRHSGAELLRLAVGKQPATKPLIARHRCGNMPDGNSSFTLSPPQGLKRNRMSKPRISCIDPATVSDEAMLAGLERRRGRAPAGVRAAQQQ